MKKALAALSLYLCACQGMLPIARELPPWDWTETLVTDGTGVAHSPWLTQDSIGNPTLLWIVGDPDHEDTNFVYGAHFDDGSWRELSPGSTQGAGLIPQIAPFRVTAATSPDDTLYLAWLTLSDVYVRRLQNGVWQSVGAGSDSGGGISNGGGVFINLSIAITRSGTPLVAWDASPGSPDTGIYVSRFNGTAWEPLASRSATNFGAAGELGMGPMITSDTSNRTILSWNLNGGEIARLSGSTWTFLGSPQSTYYSAPVAADSKLYAQWMDAPASAMYVSRFTSDGWQTLGGPIGHATDGRGAYGKALLRLDDDGTPFVAWCNGVKMGVQRYDGSSWQDFPTSTTEYTPSRDISCPMALSVRAGVACIAYLGPGGTFTYTSDVYVRCASQKD